MGTGGCMSRLYSGHWGNRAEDSLGDAEISQAGPRVMPAPVSIQKGETAAIECSAGFALGREFALVRPQPALCF